MLWIMLLGCGAFREARDADEAVIRDEMAAHSAEASQARAALINGDLEGVHKAGAALSARLPLPELPTEAQQPVTRAAEALSSASTLEVAAAQIAQLGAGCGSCHTTVGADVSLPPLSTASPNEAFDAQMQRYHWASERMWQGLVLSSDTAFDEARAALRQLPTASFAPQLDGELPVTAETLDATVHEMASKAGPGNAEMYGAMLLTCVLCHVHSPDSPAND